MKKKKLKKLLLGCPNTHLFPPTLKRQMVLTRSQTHYKQPIKKKFTDDDFSDEEKVSPLSPVQPEDDYLSEEEEEEDDDDDSDDAPEEESTSKARSDILSEQKRLQQVEAELKKQEREKRKALDLRNTQQQQMKKSKQKSNPSTAPIELPEFLPDDITSIINQPVEELKPRHIRLDEIEASPKLDKKSLLEEKLRLLKAKKKVAIKKGPVHVKIQSFNSKVVPRSESKIVKNRDKWLHRKSVNRK